MTYQAAVILAVPLRVLFVMAFLLLPGTTISSLL